MRRLVYRPKVQVWVKSDYGIIELTDYITNVKVNRKVNQVSSATLTFRNPGYWDDKFAVYRKVFTEHQRSDGTYGPMFHPMDPIVISMTRLRDKPIQIFTGYCDTTPYLSLYPGTVEIEASCTLKRLQYTYWDPGLPFTIEFLANYGWQIDPRRGGIVNSQAEQSQTQVGQQNGENAPAQQPSTVNKFNDGSIANLLFAVLQHVGGWDPSIIWIEALPQGIAGKVMQLYQDIEKTNEDSLNQFEDLLTQTIGTMSLGEGGAGGGGGGGDDEIVSTYNGPLDKLFPKHFLDDQGYARLSPAQVKELAESVGLPGDLFEQIAHGESSYYPGVVQHDPGDGNVGWGLWQITPNAWPAGSLASQYLAKLGGIEQMLNPVKCAKMAKFLYEHAASKTPGTDGFPWYGTDYAPGGRYYSG